MWWFIGIAVAVFLSALVWAFFEMLEAAKKTAIGDEKNHRIRYEKIKKLGIPTGHSTDTFIWLVEKHEELEKRVAELEKNNDLH